jgi:hypothetical protein
MLRINFNYQGIRVKAAKILYLPALNPSRIQLRIDELQRKFCKLTYASRIKHANRQA